METLRGRTMLATHRTEDAEPISKASPPSAVATLVPAPLSSSGVLALQQSAGNAATNRVLRASAPARCSCGGVITADGECTRCRARREAADQRNEDAVAGALARAAAARAEASADEPGRCHYEPGERERSARSEGAFDQQVGVDTVTTTLSDFTPGSAQVKSNHHVFIREQIAQAGLNDPNADLEIAVFAGFTDCVDTEGKNVSIRARRAEAVKAAYLDAGAAPELLGPFEAASSGPAPGQDGDPDGRMRNRAVTLVLRRRLITPEPPPQGEPPARRCPECDAATTWRAGVGHSSRSAAST